MDCRITTYLPENRIAVADLQQLLWQGGRLRNARYLNWKYFCNPYLDGRYLVLAWSGEQLVGMIGAFGASWELPGSGRTMLPCLSDTVVIPSHRGSSLFRLMLDRVAQRLAADGVPWLLDFGDQPAGPAMLMRGWKSVGPWAVATSGRRANCDDAGGEGWTIPRRALGRRSRLELKGTPTIDTSAVAELIARAEPADRIRHVRDEAYLDWRFQNPLADYYHVAAGEGIMQGYLLGHRTRVDSVSGDTPTTIMDCEAENDEIWADLIEAALNWLPGREVLMWVRDLTPSRLGMLNDMGMQIKRPTGRLTADVDLPNLLMYPTGARFTCEILAELSNPALWDLRSICGRSWR